MKIVEIYFISKAISFDKIFIFVFSPEARQCYFSHEGNLQMFSYYTENNCKLDCLWKKATEVQITFCEPKYQINRFNYKYIIQV